MAVPISYNGSGYVVSFCERVRKTGERERVSIIMNFLNLICSKIRLKL